MKRLPIIITCLFLSLNAFSQKIANEIILSTSESNMQLLRSVKAINSQIDYVELKPLCKTLDIYLMSIETNDGSDVGNQVISHLETNHDVQYAYYNQKTHQRATPSDTRFPNQWNLELIQADVAWDQTKGGSDINGQEIVIAIMDDGFDVNHEDIQNNLWINGNEIAGDGMDNDFNGFIDDMQGIDLDSDTGIIVEKSHGTSVMGIIGADSDNDQGIAGINWNTKIMVLSSVTNEARVIAGYDYIYQERRRFNASDGLTGTFIVATNYSLGINNEFGEDHQAWCNMYDLMGEEGIVSVGATTNENNNVDVVGDLPTTCASSYFIGVTNTDRNDVKVTNAGYGVENIDLSAPGRNTESIKPGSQYGLFGGTSASAPHVTGAIGLLNALQCENLSTFIKESPGESALRIRQAILNGADPLPSLLGQTVTGGRLNIVNSMADLAEFCSDNPLTPISGDLNINYIRQEDSLSYTLFYPSPDTREVAINLYDMAGRKIYSTLSRPGFFSASRERIYLDGQPSGVYIATITLDDKVVSYKLRHLAR